MEYVYILFMMIFTAFQAVITTWLFFPFVIGYMISSTFILWAWKKIALKRSKKVTIGILIVNFPICGILFYLLVFWYNIIRLGFN